MRVKAMMDIPPDKRPRLSGPSPTQWQNSPESSRQLPPPPNPPYQQHQSPFSRPPEPHPLDHRRPSEPPQYDHQDPRRPSSGPSHGYHNGPAPPPPLPPSYAGHRDPMVKRDPSDEPPQQYRPPSTGADHNVNPPPHHEGPGRPFHPPYDPARNQPYPPNPYPPPPPIQSPMSATEPYNVSYGPPGLPPAREYPSLTYPSVRADNTVRKKAQRAAQACDSCRTLKAKCDEGRPACSTCKEKGQECRYRDPPPKQQDKDTAVVIDFLVNFKGELNSKFESIESQIRELKQNQSRMMGGNANYEPMFKQEVEENAPPAQIAYARPSVSLERQPVLSNESPYGSTPSQQTGLERLPQGGEVSEEEEESGNPGPGKPPAIPVNHTTGAARLLSVPAIKELCKDAMKSSKIKNEKYPILQEERRGLLRLFGRGEGYEPPPGYDKDPLGDLGSEGTPGDSHSDVSSPAGDEWGQMGGLTPPGNQPDLIRGGINADGMPDLSRETVETLVDSYFAHINIMHPILVRSRLNLLVEQFLKSITDSQAKPKQVSSLVSQHTSHHGAGFVGSYRNPESPGNKRKRSPVSGEYADPPTFMDQKPGHPNRSIGSAIVLLVMALGKICQHTGRIPDAWHADRELDNSHGSSPTVRNGHPPSPLQSSPAMSSTGLGMASPLDGERLQSRSRRTSIDGPYTGRIASKARNIDAIPGLAYHALATDVIGNQLAGNSLQHVHANILAGLYHGQLARVMESHGYIAAACRSLQVILRPKLEKLKKIKIDGTIVPEKDNALVIAFWTCLQLESDIVAELPCPHSGILTYEDDMPHPNIQSVVDNDGVSPLIVESYIAQLFLRKHLNQLHNMFYRPENDSAPFPPVATAREHFPTIEASLANLKSIDVIAPNFKWNADIGEPADNILGARLRAKYYGAEVITYRHFVLKILERSSGREQQITGEYLPNIEAPVVDQNATRLEDFDDKVLQYADAGLKALIHSTRAFYGLGDPGKKRLIVTNIWGTAHAQWGNVVTLQAAYMNPILKSILSRIISKEELQRLTEKTMAFLSLTSTPTSALHSDLKILRAMSLKTGLTGTNALQGPNTNSSFSSSNTGDITMGGH